MEITKGNVRTTYVAKVVATTLGSCTTPTKPTTMQGRQMPLDYAWPRSTHLCGRLTTGGRDNKNITVHNYLEGYFHVEACDYSFKGARHTLSGEGTTVARRQLHQYFFGAKLLGQHATTIQPTWRQCEDSGYDMFGATTFGRDGEVGPTTTQNV